ncbi:YkvA family protein [Phascolarctobacterium sp.]|uniref:YkvA family protein n=1 Tax=Phascolarctobacterium sp. TaxID=2049039 RepID=UPI00386BA26D
MAAQEVESKELQKYEAQYSEKGLGEKVLKYAKTAGKEVVYKVFQLWFVLQKPEVPTKVKAVIMGTLGYFIAPLDLIPDVAAGVGYTDDASVIAFALVYASMYIDDEVNAKAQQKVDSIFGN